MSTETLEKPDTTTTTSDNDMSHAFCTRCNDMSPGYPAKGSIALCGHEKKRDGVTAKGNRCVVCLDLQWEPCGRCGR